MLAAGDFGKMVALRDGNIVGVPLDKVAGRVKAVPLDHEMFKAARDVGTCLGD
jgi:6-phosphofructokinase 1